VLEDMRGESKDSDDEPDPSHSEEVQSSSSRNGSLEALEEKRPAISFKAVKNLLSLSHLSKSLLSSTEHKPELDQEKQPCKPPGVVLQVLGPPKRRKSFHVESSPSIPALSRAEEPKSFNHLHDLIWHLVHLRRVDACVLKAKSKFRDINKKRIVIDGHPRFILALKFSMGLNQALELDAKELPCLLRDFIVKPEDYEERKTFGFSSGPADGHDPRLRPFRFKNFCGRMFMKIRSLFGIQDNDMLKSLTRKPWKEFFSNSRGGQALYISGDQKYFIKSINKSEIRLLKKHFFRGYFEHMEQFPSSFLMRVLGVYRLQIESDPKIFFIIMQNCLYTDLEIHRRYDLKGSLIDRCISKRHKHLLYPIYKDQEFVFHDQKLYYGGLRDFFVKQLEIDVKFLQKFNIMDYSLLVGIHEFDEEKRRLRKQFQSYGGVSAEMLPYRALKTLLLDTAEVEEVVVCDCSEPQCDATVESPSSPCSPYKGGIVSADGKCVYFCGIIDIFQEYNMKKIVEHRYKEVKVGQEKADMISAIPSDAYAERFVKFLSQRFRTVPCADDVCCDSDRATDKTGLKEKGKLLVTAFSAK